MKSIDKPLLIAFTLLAIFGLIMMSSISIASSLKVSDNNSYYFFRHFIYIALGIVVFFMALKFPIRLIKKYHLLFYLTAAILLLLVLIVGEDFGTAAKSWIRVGGFSLQPVEIAKLAVIITLAAILSKDGGNIRTMEDGLIPFSLIIIFPAILIMNQPDFGSLFVLVLTSSLIYFVAGANWKHFLSGSILTLFSATTLFFVYPHVAKRLSVFLNPDLDPLGAGFQVKQALIAIGSGGVFGRGFQNSIQKFDYLPEVQSDTIFSAIAEEMGFFRILILLLFYAFIAYRGYLIAQRSNDKFNQLLAFGLTSLIVVQAFLNIAANLALFPNTGITLPLISYGGTSLLSFFAAIGILLQISSKIEDHRKKYILR